VRRNGPKFRGGPWVAINSYESFRLVAREDRNIRARLRGGYPDADGKGVQPVQEIGFGLNQEAGQRSPSANEQMYNIPTEWAADQAGEL
jgi:hypothetical protein